MYEKRIPIEEGQTLTLVEMADSVSVTRWDEADVFFRLREGKEDDLTIEETEQGPAVSAQRPCAVRVPANVPVTIRQVQANLKVEGIADLNAEQVRGNLRLDDVGKAVVAEVYGNLKAGVSSSLRVVGTVYGDAVLKAVPNADLQNVRGNLVAKATDRLHASRVGGNLRAKEMSGRLDADKVGGNALLRNIGGAVKLDQVAGNLVAKNLTGGVKAPKVGGNLILSGELGSGCTYHFNVRGNGILRLSPETSAHLTLSSRAKLLHSVTLKDEIREEGKLSGTLGDGGTEVVVEATGNVIVGDGDRGISIELGDEVQRQVEESLRAVDLEAVGRRVSEEMEAAMSRLQVKMESVDWDRIGVQTQQAVERAMERMRENMDRMVEKAARHQERLERKAERAALRLERRERRREKVRPRRRRDEVEVPDWPGEEDVEPLEPEPDLDEERLSILRMVEQGTITPEDAEMLLDALQ